MRFWRTRVDEIDDDLAELEDRVDVIEEKVEPISVNKTTSLSLLGATTNLVNDLTSLGVLRTDIVYDRGLPLHSQEWRAHVCEPDVRYVDRPYPVPVQLDNEAHRVCVELLTDAARLWDKHADEVEVLTGADMKTVMQFRVRAQEYRGHVALLAKATGKTWLCNDPVNTIKNVRKGVL